MRYRIALVPLLGVALLTLVALAHASPPDPTWQPGFYDDADFDDVVALLISLSGATPASPCGSLHHPRVASGILIPTGPGDLPTRLLLPDASRSPPSS
jgi:hypothetical protein